MERRCAAVTCWICKGLAAGEDQRCYRVVENGLPHDTKFVSADMHLCRTIRMVLESDEFENETVLPSVMLESIEP